MKIVGAVALALSVALFVFPATTLAVSTLVWGNVVEDPDTGETIVEDRIDMRNGGTYAVPLNVSRDVQIRNDDPFVFGAEGMLFYIPNPDESTREFVNRLGGFVGAETLAWERPGVYELDVYEIEAPVPTLNPFSRFFTWLFGTPAHAQSSESFIETIRFTVTEEGAVEECCSSVLFLPGIKGSRLRTASDVLWPPTVWSDDVPQLALNETGESVNDIYVDGIIEDFTIGPYSKSVYSPFADFLDQLVSDGIMNGWLPLAYDWRFSPEQIVEDGIETSNGVKDVVAEVENLAAQSQTGQVTIVAHSMGGLVGKALIKKLEEEGKDDLIDSFVMVGVPQLGTPQAAAALLHGDDEGAAGGFIVRASEVRAVAQNMPGAYSLLPSSRYFEEVLAPVIAFSTLADFTEPWRNFWGPFINTYSDFAEFATGQGVARTEPPEDLLRVPEILRADLVQDAANFHTEYDTYEFPDNIRVVQIAGWGRPTVKEIEYVESHGFPGYRVIPSIEGDGTVVYPSAIASGSEEYYFFDLQSYRKDKGENAQHGDLLNKESIQDLLRTVIQEESFSNTTYVLSIKPEVASIEDMLIVSTYSPVVLGVYDTFGNFTGIDPNQDLSADILSITEDIPGSTFLYSAESQYVFVPKNGTYNFVYKGVGNGSTTVTVEKFSNETVTSVSNYSDIPTTESTKAAFEINSITPEEAIIEVDTNGDGNVDEEVLADEAELSLEELIALLKQKIQALDAKNKLKKKLFKKIEDIEKKIAKDKKKKAQKIIHNLGKKVSKKEMKGKIEAASAEEILELLERIENELK